MTDEQIRNTRRLVWQAIGIYLGMCLVLGILFALFR